MKKLSFLAVAALALSFAACGNKTGAAAEPDSLAVEEVASAADQAGAVVALLQEQLQNADPEQIKAIGEQVAAKVAEFVAKGDEAAAAAYTEAINSFISANADKLKEIGAATTIADALSAVEGVPANVVESAAAAAEGVKASAEEAAAEQVEAAKEAVSEAAAATQQAAEDAVNEAAQQAADAAAAAQQKAQDKANQAIDDAAAAAKKKLGL